MKAPPQFTPPDLSAADRVAALHSAWCQASGQPLNLRATERVFWELDKCGFTPNDVTCVVQHLTAFNRRSEGAKFRINLTKICGQIEDFASLLAEAQAAERNRIKPLTPKESVLASTGRPPEPPKENVRPAFDVLREIVKSVGLLALVFFSVSAFQVFSVFP